MLRIFADQVFIRGFHGIFRLVPWHVITFVTLHRLGSTTAGVLSDGLAFLGHALARIVHFRQQSRTLGPPHGSSLQAARRDGQRVAQLSPNSHALKDFKVRRGCDRSSEGSHVFLNLLRVWHQ